MTPMRVKEIFDSRGFHAAKAVAEACQEPMLVDFVKKLGKEALGGGKTERARASGALSRYFANREKRAEENRARAHGRVNGGEKKEKKNK